MALFLFCAAMALALLSFVVLGVAVVQHRDAKRSLAEMRELHKEAVDAIDCHERWMERSDEPRPVRPALVLAFPAPERMQ